MAEGTYEEIGDEVEFDWGLAPPIEPRSGGLGDHFPPGVRCAFETTRLTYAGNKDTGKKRIDLEAMCLDGESAGLTLKESYYFATREEIAVNKNKAFGARRFHAFMLACGAPPQTSLSKIKLSNFAGARFDAVPKDKIIEARTRTMPDGSEKSYPQTVSSEIDNVFRPGDTRPVTAEGMGAASGLDTPDVSNVVRSRLRAA